VPVPLGLSDFDDMLFIRSANFLVQGAWLGPFDNLTLAKGPSYPLFIATMHELGIPLKIGEQLTFLAAAAAVATCVWLATRNLPLSTGAYVLLAMDPINFNAQSAELVRDNWYGSLSLLFVAVTFIAVFIIVYRFRWIWRLLVATAAGFVGSVLWLCREEGPTILPPVAVVALGLPALVLTQRWLARTRTDRRPNATGPVLLRLAVPIAVAVVAFVLPIVAVMAVNDRVYGAPLINDTAAGTMPRAFADWTRVRAGAPVPQAPITQAQRRAVYAVSPAARELASSLENPDFPWHAVSCGDSPDCEYLGAFMIWAVRDATRNAGHYTSEPDAEAYFARLSEEIRAACDSGQLQCAPSLPATLQSVQRADPAVLADGFVRVAGTAWLSHHFYEFTADPARPAVSDEIRAQNVAVVRGIPVDQTAADQQLASFQAHIWPYRLLGSVYTVAVPVLALLAIGGCLIGFWRPQAPRSTLLVLTLALATGFGVRTGLLALISATDFNADIVRYQLPNHVFLIGFGVTGTAFLLAAVRGRPVAPAPDPITPSGAGAACPDQ